MLTEFEHYVDDTGELTEMAWEAPGFIRGEDSKSCCRAMQADLPDTVRV